MTAQSRVQFASPKQAQASDSKGARTGQRTLKSTYEGLARTGRLRARKVSGKDNKVHLPLV